MLPRAAAVAQSSHPKLNWAYWSGFSLTQGAIAWYLSLCLIQWQRLQCANFKGLHLALCSGVVERRRVLGRRANSCCADGAAGGTIGVCPKHFEGPVPRAGLSRAFEGPVPRAGLSQAFEGPVPTACCWRLQLKLLLQLSSATEPAFSVHKSNRLQPLIHLKNS